MPDATPQNAPARRQRGVRPCLTAPRRGLTTPLTSPRSPSSHGPNASVDDVIAAAQAFRALVAEVGREMGVEGSDLKILSVCFKCDGCGLTRADRPSPDEGWTYADGDDFCPDCTRASTKGE